MIAEAPGTLTIGRLARAASVGVETIRYYQQRGLLPVPSTQGAFRHYPVALTARIRFIKRSQELGFSLDEITELLRLEDGIDRGAIRRIASDRLGQIEQKLADLKRMQRVLKQLVTQCERTVADLPCPIIATRTTPQRNYSCLASHWSNCAIFIFRSDISLRGVGFNEPCRVQCRRRPCAPRRVVGDRCMVGGGLYSAALDIIVAMTLVVCTPAHPRGVSRLSPVDVPSVLRRFQPRSRCAWRESGPGPMV